MSDHVPESPEVRTENLRLDLRAKLVLAQAEIIALAEQMRIDMEPWLPILKRGRRPS